MRDFRLDGKVALVTGSAGLLGTAHCRALRRAGAHVIVTDLDEGACTKFAEELSTVESAQPSAEVMVSAADITARDGLENLRDAIDRRFGRLDVLVNNAAINDKFESPEAAADLSRFENYPLELFERSLRVNVTGMFLCCQVLGSYLKDTSESQGSIVNVASTYGLVAPDQSLYRTPSGEQPFYKSPAYPTTKGAVLQLTRFLAAYWGEHGIRVNALCPGGVEAGQDSYFVAAYSKKTPLGRMARFDDYEGAIVFLASDASRYMTGATLVVDGGFTTW